MITAGLVILFEAGLGAIVYSFGYKHGAEDYDASIRPEIERLLGGGRK